MFYELIDINTSFHIKERNNIERVKPLPSIMLFTKHALSNRIFVSEHVFSSAGKGDVNTGAYDLSA